MDVAREEYVVTDLLGRQAMERQRLVELRKERGAGSADRRRDEQEQLVDEVVAEERGRDRRAAFEQDRLDALVGQRAQLLVERARPELERRAVRQRPAPEREPARL